MKKSLIAELILFILLLAVLAFLGVKIFKHTFDIGQTYHVEFKDIDSIVVGSPVRILGVDIGHVTKIQSASDKIYIDFVVTNDKVKLPQGTKATIEFFGIAGSRSIELTPPAKNSKEKGLIVREPIRIGDAFGIMEEFLKATMVSIAGIYQFAKNRTQDDAANDTAAMLKATNEADDKIVDITSTIQKGGARVHKSFLGTTKGMERVYNEASVFNFNENVNRAKYGVRLTKRSLMKAHRSIKKLNKEMEVKIEKMNIQNDKLKSIKNNINSIKNIDESIEKFSTAIENFDKNMTQENLDKIYNAIENMKEQSSELEKSI